MDNYFFRVSNDVIRSKSFDAKNICTQFILNEVRGLSDKCLLSIKYLIDNCGYAPRNGRDGVNSVYKTIMKELERDGYIIFDERYKMSESNLRIDDLLVLKIIPDKFDIVDNFTKLTLTEFNSIIRCNNHHNKGKLLHTYLYIKSYYHQATTINRPFGFHQSLKVMSVNIDVSEKALISLLNTLIDLGLLIKHYTGSREVPRTNKNSRINVPNIYIPNLGQSQDEIDDTIQSTVKAMKEHYGVDSFLPFMKNLKEN